MLPARERLVDRAARSAVAVPVVHGGVLEQLAVGDQAIELGVVDEEVVLAVDLARARRPRRRRDRQVDLGVVLLDLRGDRALADGGGPGEHDEAAAPAARARLGPARVEELLQRAALAGAEPAELLHGRDLELLQDAVALALADRPGCW